MSMSEAAHELSYYDGVGLHQHKILHKPRVTASGGAHSHMWLLPEDIAVGDRVYSKGYIFISDYDGAHSHALAADLAGTAEDGAHMHAVRIWAQAGNASSDLGGAHSHSLGVMRTGTDGAHSHMLDLSGTKIPSMTPAVALAIIIAADEASGEEEVDRSATVTSTDGRHVVTQLGAEVCAHADQESADKCAEMRSILRTIGLEGDSNIHGVAWLVKEAGILALEQAAADVEAKRSPTIPGRLLGSLARLVDED